MHRNHAPGGERMLHDKARQAMVTGRLPGRRPERTWGGMGSGRRCAICDVPVRHDEVELELEFAGCDDHRPVPGPYHVHVRCLAAWEHVLDQVEPAAFARVADVFLEPGSAAATDAGSSRALSGADDSGKISAHGLDHRPRRGPA